MMNKYGALAVLALFLAAGGATVYNNLNGESNDTYVAVDEPVGRTYMVDLDTEEEIEVQMFYYAAETYDGVLIPLAFASELITDDDKEQFMLLTDTIFPQIDSDEIDKGAEMLMLHANRNRAVPVFIEVIRVSE